MREGGIINLARDKPSDDMPRLEGWGAIKDPQPVAPRCAPEVIGANREIQAKHLKGMSPGDWHTGIAAAPTSKSASTGNQLKCHYANACSMGNKQEDLEMCAHLQSYDHTGITETWWDGSYDWSVGMEEYRLFRKDRLGRGGGGVALYVNDQLECLELHLGMDEEPRESLWVKIKGSTGAGDVTIGVCYRPPD
ncbi:hypothetical protein llap_13164 [Limosa lapponica baueri]|uniref:Uncharacterized protein n=1 Tax=Limosa lapponica baueri TaxID=1758121 RepID=A0A2I0TRV8_LIMLA|nr:hypothetical protein llap_13164 [Limosa lapponica baueri]